MPSHSLNASCTWLCTSNRYQQARLSAGPNNVKEMMVIPRELSSASALPSDYFGRYQSESSHANTLVSRCQLGGFLVLGGSSRSNASRLVSKFAWA